MQPDWDVIKEIIKEWRSIDIMITVFLKQRMDFRLINWNAFASDLRELADRFECLDDKR